MNADRDAKIAMMVRLLRMNGHTVSGAILARDLKLTPRRLRELVHEAVHKKGLWQIVGIPGKGYRWSEEPAIQQHAVKEAVKRAVSAFARAKMHEPKPIRQPSLFGKNP